MRWPVSSCVQSNRVFLCAIQQGFSRFSAVSRCLYQHASLAQHTAVACAGSAKRWQFRGGGLKIIAAPFLIFNFKISHAHFLACLHRYLPVLMRCCTTRNFTYLLLVTCDHVLSLRFPPPSSCCCASATLAMPVDLSKTVRNVLPGEPRSAFWSSPRIEAQFHVCSQRGGV